MHTIRIEVVFALADRQDLAAFDLDANVTAGEAIEQSGIAAKFPDYDLSQCGLGIWGRSIDASQNLQDGDRLEIYRPLQIDPREARRQLASEGKSMGGQDGSKGPPEILAEDQRSGRSS